MGDRYNEGMPQRWDRPEVHSETGVSSEGVPLAFNRPPDERIADWVGRSMVAYAYDRTGEPVSGLLCNDAAYLRCAVGVDWRVDTADGRVNVRDQTFLTGQHTKAMPLHYKGGVKVAGLMLRPGALSALFGIDDSTLTDRLLPLDQTGISDREVTGLYNLDLTPAEWLARIEGWLADYIEKNAVQPPDPVSRAMELQTFVDPNRSLDELAEEVGVSRRTMERIARRDFGMSPKKIMRRARVLDIAARSCGVADEAEAEEFLLRFFDQAHLIREFSTFFGTTPHRFIRERHPLLTLSLEIRQARRLELLDRTSPGSVRPWMRKDFQAPLARQA